MSAFVIDKAHINAMLNAANNVRYKPFSWYHNGERHTLDETNLDETGQILLDECVESVSYRYPDCSITDLPGRCDAEWTLPFIHRYTNKTPKPLEAIKITECYTYQSCEHPGWKSSEAKAFCDSIIKNMIGSLPGYDEAPWDWEDEAYYTDNIIRII